MLLSSQMIFKQIMGAINGVNLISVWLILFCLQKSDLWFIFVFDIFSFNEFGFEKFFSLFIKFVSIAVT